MAAKSGGIGVALRYGASSLLLLLLTALVVDHLIMAPMETDGTISSQHWENANLMINQGIATKNKADRENPVWRSPGHPVQEGEVDHPRILVSGDSFVWGSGVLNINELHWRQLERELHSRGYREVEVVGAGMSGDSTLLQLRAFPRLVARYKPDLVIWGYVSNDPDEAKVPLLDYAKIEKDPLFGWLSAASAKGPLRRVSYQLREARKKKLVAEASMSNGYAYEDWELQLLKGPSLEGYAKTLQQVSQAMDRFQVPGFMVTLPNYPDPQHWPIRYEPILPAAKAAGLVCHDLFPGFLEWSKTLPNEKINYWRANPANGHPGPGSTAYFARAMADILERDYAEILGPAQPGSAALVLNDWWPPTMELSHTDRAWSFDYPTESFAHLRFPGGKGWLRFYLAEPTKLQSISVEGPGLKSAALAVTTVRPELGFDPGEVTVSTESSRLESTQLSNQLINSIWVRAEVETSQPRVSLKLQSQ